MFCANCGFEIADSRSAKFCPRCGDAIRLAPSQALPTQQVVEPQVVTPVIIDPQPAASQQQPSSQNPSIPAERPQKSTAVEKANGCLGTTARIYGAVLVVGGIAVGIIGFQNGGGLGALGGGALVAIYGIYLVLGGSWVIY